MDFNNYYNPQSKSYKTYYIIGGALIVVILVVVLGFKLFSKKSLAPSDLGSNFEVSKVDLSKQGNNVPAGFPSDVPVETTQPTQSETVNYPDAKTTQYTYSYISTQTVKDKYNTYQDLAKTSGYKIVSQDGSKGYIYLSKDNNELSVNITVSDGKTLVQLVYLKHN